MRKPRKADIARLRKLLERMNKTEAMLRAHHGPAVSGTMRVGAIKDAEALHNVLAFIDDLKAKGGE